MGLIWTVPDQWQRIFLYGSAGLVFVRGMAKTARERASRPACGRCGELGGGGFFRKVGAVRKQWGCGYSGESRVCCPGVDVLRLSVGFIGGVIEIRGVWKWSEVGRRGVRRGI